MSERVILHSDMNCFYASVEMLHHPEFAGQPLAVGGDPEARHGIVLTANYVAKRKGVMDILVSRNLDSGNMETGIPERKPSLIGLIKTHKKSNECQAQSRFAGHKPALHL